MPLHSGYRDERENDDQKAINNVDTLISYLHDPRMMFFALNQLKALSSNNNDNKDLICAKGVISPCVQLLHPSQKNMIHDKVLRLLRSLSVTTNNQIAISRAGAIPLLINFIRGTDPNLQVNAVAILWNLSVHSENKEFIGKGGGIEALVTLLVNTTKDNVRNETIGALRNLSHHPPNRYRIVRAGGVEPLLQMLDPDKVREATRKHALVALVQCANDAEGLNAIKRLGPGGMRTLQETCREIDSQLESELQQLLARDGTAVAKRQGLPEKSKTVAQKSGFHKDATGFAETTVVRDAMAAEEGNNPFAVDAFGTMHWPSIVLEEQIGSGAYSTVYKGRYNGFGVAVKILNDELPEDVNKREKMLQEHKLLSMLRHPNCLLYMGSAITPENKLAIITELMLRGSLKDAMAEVKNMTLRMKWGKDIVQGLNWLHSNSIIHRDLKPANILISADWSARISDYGLSLFWSPDCVCLRFKGNVKYSAPEVLAVRAQSDKKKAPLRYTYGPATDVFSSALILWELVTNEPLFEGIKGKQEITDFVCAGNRPELRPGWPRSLTTLLERMWHPDPSQRILFPAIQAEYSNVMIDFLCPDPTGRKIARDLFLGDEMRRVPYTEFEESFQEHTGIDLNTGSQCYRRCLQAMLCDPHSMVVTFEQWCNCIHWIGVVNPIKDFLNRLVRLFEQPYFYGFIANRDAKRLLLEQQKRTPEAPGYYLIRFSENWPGSFTIYSVDKEGNTSHRRISHQYSSGFCVTFDGKIGKEFPDLFMLHDQCCENGTCLQGLFPLPGAPYQHFFAAHPLRITNTSASASGNGAAATTATATFFDSKSPKGLVTKGVDERRGGGEEDDAEERVVQRKKGDEGGGTQFYSARATGFAASPLVGGKSGGLGQGTIAAGGRGSGTTTILQEVQGNAVRKGVIAVGKDVAKQNRLLKMI